MAHAMHDDDSERPAALAPRRVLGARAPQREKAGSTGLHRGVVGQQAAGSRTVASARRESLGAGVCHAFGLGAATPVGPGPGQPTTVLGSVERRLERLRLGCGYQIVFVRS